MGMTSLLLPKQCYGEMGFRFRRRVRLGKGVYLNLSKSGVSASLGGKGLTYNTRGRVTASLPGTGLSYSTTLSKGTRQGAPVDTLPAQSCSPAILIGLFALIIGLIFPPLFIIYLVIFALWVAGKLHMEKMQKDHAFNMARKERIKAYRDMHPDGAEVADTSIPPVPPRLPWETPAAVPDAAPSPKNVQPKIVSVTADPELSNKKLTAGLLGIFLGAFGIHKFMLGYTTSGVIMLAVSVAGGVITCGIATFGMGVIGVIEGINYLSKPLDQFKATYIDAKREWF